MSAVTGPRNDVSIRQPLALRIFVVAFLVFWEGTLVRMMLLHARASSIAFFVLFAGFGLGIGYRSIRLGVSSTPEGTLTIRNNLATRVLTRPEIEDFRVGTSGGTTALGVQSLQILLSDGTVYGIDIGKLPLRLGEKQNGRRLQSLRNWLQAPDAPMSA